MLISRLVGFEGTIDPVMGVCEIREVITTLRTSLRVGVGVNMSLQVLLPAGFDISDRYDVC